MLDELLSNSGVLVTVVLSINAFYLRGIYSKIYDVEMKVVESITDHKSTKEDVKRLEQEVEKMRGSIHNHANEITALIMVVKNNNKG